MKAAKLVWKNFKAIHDKLGKYDAKRVKNAQTATRVEGFRLMKAMIREVKAGAPGGRSFNPLTILARKVGGSSVSRGRVPARKRFTKLFSTMKASPGYLKGVPPIRYNAHKLGGKFNVSVGFITFRKTSIATGDVIKNTLSKSWQRIMTRQQEGFTVPVFERDRRFFAAVGASMPKRSRLRKYFFLKKSTTQFKIPANPIIDPFWNAHRDEAQRNIISNFERKMKGERI